MNIKNKAYLAAEVTTYGYSKSKLPKYISEVFYKERYS